MAKKLTKSQLDVLFECWKDGDTTKDRLELVAKRLPKISPLVAISTMRTMSKTDIRWQKMATRKRNKEEKEKLEKVAKKEEKKVLAVQKKTETEKKKLEKDKIKKEKDRINYIKENFKTSHSKEIINRIGIEYFFCSDLDQYTNNISCLFRLFSNEYPVILDTKCESCIKMNKYISLIEEILKNERATEHKRYKTRKGSEIKEPISKTGNGKSKSTSNS